MQDFIAQKAEGSYVWTTDGQKHLDMACGKTCLGFPEMLCCLQFMASASRSVYGTGIGVASTGHCHPKVVKAIQDQASDFIIAQQNVFTSSPAMVRLHATGNHAHSHRLLACMLLLDAVQG